MKIISALAGILFVIGFIPYILSIFKKETRPARASWIIWTILDYIVFAGMLTKHTVNGQIVGAIIGATIVIGLALKYGESGWTKTDKFTLAGAALGIALWIATNNPLYGILISCAVALIGSIPTVTSAWEDPSREDRTAWTIFWLSCVCAVISIPHWTLADAAQPLTFSVIESATLFVLIIRPRMLAKAAPAGT